MNLFNIESPLCRNILCNNCNIKIDKTNIPPINLKSFEINDYNSIIRIPINNIILTKSILNGIKDELNFRDYNYNFIINKTSKQCYDDGSHILLNINHTRKSFQNKETISPIIVKKYFDSELYYIVKGKHRFLMTLFENKDFIDSIICN